MENQYKNLKINVFLFFFYILLICPNIHSQQTSEPRTLTGISKVEFLGWDYSRNGYTLSQGENVDLFFRNNTEQVVNFSVNWTLNTYKGEFLTKGGSELSLNAGRKGSVAISLPQEMEDGPYMIYYSLDAEGWQGTHPFYFDFHKPLPDEFLNLNLVALIENIDTKGWTRMMLGPLARFCNVMNDFPENTGTVDAAILIGEALDFYNPKLSQIMDYVREGGTLIVFGKTAPVLSYILPVSGSSGKPAKLNPLSLNPLSEGPWQDFLPDSDFLHYPIEVTAREGSTILAEWSDGSPAVVRGSFGLGRVIYVSTGSYQVWQKNPSLSGADEMVLRLLYDARGGSEAVNSMLSYAEKFYQEGIREKKSIRDKVFKNTGIKEPEEFLVISEDNIGRFGWLVQEGNLAENISDNGRVTALGSPKNTTDIAYSIAVSGQTSPQHSDVNQNWLAKSVEWKYANGEKIISTISLASPAILWEGESQYITVTGNGITNVAFPSKNGIKIIKQGEKLNPREMSENWLLTFIAGEHISDMPQLIVFTERPKTISFNHGLDLEFNSGGFRAMFISRLYGIKRLSPGATKDWAREIPPDVVYDASRWSRAFLNFPVRCDEIGWIENDTMKIADKFHFKNFQTDWNTKPVSTSVIPPVYVLAKNVGAPVQLPQELKDLNFHTKYGPLMGVESQSTLISIPVPLLDHRAIVPAKGGMELSEMINRNVRGLDLNNTVYNDQVRYYRGGKFDEDILPYDLSHLVPYNEAPHIDLYKWWLVFNAILTRPVYDTAVRMEVDRHFTTRYWETLNFYPHKSLLVNKREPFTGIEYMITFLWPTNTSYGFRNFNDINEAAGVNVYCYTNYARYYGDWTTLKANWNLCRELHDYLRKTQDWACMASGATEYWQTAGLDMLNSEPYGSLTFAYAAENAGYPEDALKGKIIGTRSLITAVARLGLKPYIDSISDEGDPWQKNVSYHHFNEVMIQGSPNRRGGIAFLNTSKGAMHELALAYKLWAPQAMNNEQMAIEEAGRSALCDYTQRLFLGWDKDSLIKKVVDNPTYHQENPTRFQEAQDLYDMAVLCAGNVPVFLSNWAPAEYVSGKFDADAKIMQLAFKSHLDEPYTVQVYSQFEPVKLRIDNNTLNKKDWSYNKKTGWLEVTLKGKVQKELIIQFGKLNMSAPLHPYFSYNEE